MKRIWIICLCLLTIFCFVGCEATGNRATLVGTVTEIYDASLLVETEIGPCVVSFPDGVTREELGLAVGDTVEIIHSGEIAGELSSPSVLAEALSAMQKPYFRLALDTRYRFEVTPDTVFTIERHRAYPQPGLVYSRLFPKAQGATLHFMEHGFAEKEEYTQTFKSASRSASIGERVSRILLLIFASIFTLLLVLAAIWTGLVGFCLVLVFAVLICGGCGLIFAMCTATRKLRDRLFLADFENETIAANFRKAMQKNAIDIN